MCLCVHHFSIFPLYSRYKEIYTQTHVNRYRLIGVCSIRGKKRCLALASDRCSLVLTFHASNWCLPIVIVTKGEWGRAKDRERENETREDEDVMDDEVEGREEEEENGDSRRHNLYDEGQPFDVINGWSHCCCWWLLEGEDRSIALSLTCVVEWPQIDPHGEGSESRRSVRSRTRRRNQQAYSSRSLEIRDEFRLIWTVGERRGNERSDRNRTEKWIRSVCLSFASLAAIPFFLREENSVNDLQSFADV